MKKTNSLKKYIFLPVFVILLLNIGNLAFSEEIDVRMTSKFQVDLGESQKSPYDDEVLPYYPVSTDEVLVIVNDNYYDRDLNGVSDSIDIGEYYASQRDIPRENILHVRCDSAEKGLIDLDVIKQYLDTTVVDGEPLKNKIYYIVTTLGIPVKTLTLSPLGTLALLPIDLQIESLYGRSHEYYLADDQQSYWKVKYKDYISKGNRVGFKLVESDARKNGSAPAYLVTRLDGPTVEIAKGLVDKAIYAERYVDPFSGEAFIDRHGLYPELVEPFNNVTRAFREAGLSVTNLRDIYPTFSYKDFQPGDCPNAMYYYGWYQSYFKPRFEWKVGGIGAELQSFTAASVRTTRHAVPILLHEGVTATLGFTSEPFFNDAFGWVLRYFVLDGYDFAESSHLGNANFAACRIGDPLYNVSNKNAKEKDSAPPVISNIGVNIDNFGAHFKWETDELCCGFIEYGLTSVYGSIINDKFYVANSDAIKGYYPKYYTKRHGIDPFHTFNASIGLLPGNDYHFRIHVSDPAGNETISDDSVFTTPAGADFRAEAWSPEFMTWGYKSFSDYSGFLAGKTVRTCIDGNKFLYEGNKVRIHIQGSQDKPLRVKNMLIAEARTALFDYYSLPSNASSYIKKNYSLNLNFDENTKAAVTFNGRKEDLYLDAGESAWSDWIDVPIRFDKQYIITFFVDESASGISRVGSGALKEDPLTWIYAGNVADVSDWAPLIDQESAAYEAAGNFTISPYYSLDNPTLGRTTVVYGIDSIETAGYVIQATNKAPTLNPIGDKTVNEGSSLRFNITASDPDGDPLYFGADNLPKGAHLSIAGAFSTAQFTWDPTYEQAGRYNITLWVSDRRPNSGEPYLKDFKTITIIVNNVNTPPVLNPIGDKTVLEGRLLRFDITASDPDGDLLYFGADNLPKGAQLLRVYEGISGDPFAYRFEWPTTHEQIGEYNVTFTVSDGISSNSETIHIKVQSSVISIELEGLNPWVLDCVTLGERRNNIDTYGAPGHKIHNTGNVSVGVGIGYAKVVNIPENPQPGLEQGFNTFITMVRDGIIPPEGTISVVKNLAPMAEEPVLLTYGAPTALSQKVSEMNAAYEIRVYGVEY